MAAFFRLCRSLPLRAAPLRQAAPLKGKAPQKSFNIQEVGWHMQTMYQFFPQHAIAVACELRIPDVVSGTMTTSQIAAAAGTDLEKTEILMKYLAVNGVFDRDSEGIYRHNERSEILKSTNPSAIRSTILFCYHMCSVSARGWIASLKGECSNSFQHAFNTKLGMYQYLSLPGNEELRKNFDDMMIGANASYMKFVVEDYPWKSLGKAHLVDVGGGMGLLLEGLFRVNNDFTGTVFDMTTVPAEKYWKEQCADMLPRLTLKQGSFFEEVPQGGDAYLLKQILHNWTDPDSEKILKTVAKAMRATVESNPSKRPVIIIIDQIYEFPPRHAAIPNLSAIMFTLFSSKERSLAELTKLFTAAGLKITGVTNFRGDMSAVTAELA